MAFTSRDDDVLLGGGDVGKEPLKARLAADKAAASIHHLLETYMDEYLADTGLATDKAASLFPTAAGRITGFLEN